MVRTPRITDTTPLFILGNSPATAEQIIFNEHPSYEAVSNFSSNDLLQGLKPDDAHGLWSAGTILTASFAGDAESTNSPGELSRPSLCRRAPGPIYHNNYELAH